MIGSDGVGLPSIFSSYTNKNRVHEDLRSFGIWQLKIIRSKAHVIIALEEIVQRQVGGGGG